MTSSATSQHLMGCWRASLLTRWKRWRSRRHRAYRGCDGCAHIADGHLWTANALRRLCPRKSHPNNCGTRLLDSIDPPLILAQSLSVSVPHRKSPRSWSRVSSFYGRWARLLTPTAAVLAVALIAVTVGRMCRFPAILTICNRTTPTCASNWTGTWLQTTALARSSATVSQMQGSLQQWQQTSYALAQPGNRTLVMSRPGQESNKGSHGRFRGRLGRSADGIRASPAPAKFRLSSLAHPWRAEALGWRAGCGRARLGRHATEAPRAAVAL